MTLVPKLCVGGDTWEVDSTMNTWVSNPLSYIMYVFCVAEHLKLTPASPTFVVYRDL